MVPGALPPAARAGGGTGGAGGSIGGAGRGGGAGGAGAGGVAGAAAGAGGRGGGTGGGGASGAGGRGGSASGSGGNGTGGNGTGGAAGAAGGCGVDPVTPNATQKARKALCYLYQTYGNHILAGQEENNDDNAMNYISSNTGKFPAIRAFDVNNSMAPSQCVAHSRNNGLCVFGYHMGIVSGDGYQSSQTKTDINTLLTEGTTYNQTFKTRLDNVARMVQTVQDADGVAIMRLFHEAGGTWFWWSMEGGAQYVRVYKYAFNYLTVTKGLKNMIWLMPYDGSPDGSFYPGKSLVDLGGADTYAGDGNYDPQNSLYKKCVADLRVDHADRAARVRADPRSRAADVDGDEVAVLQRLDLALLPVAVQLRLTPAVRLHQQLRDHPRRDAGALMAMPRPTRYRTRLNISQFALGTLVSLAVLGVGTGGCGSSTSEPTGAGGSAETGVAGATGTGGAAGRGGSSATGGTSSGGGVTGSGGAAGADGARAAPREAAQPAASAASPAPAVLRAPAAPRRPAAPAAAVA